MCIFLKNITFTVIKSVITLEIWNRYKYNIDLRILYSLIWEISSCYFKNRYRLCGSHLCSDISFWYEECWWIFALPALFLILADYQFSFFRIFQYDTLHCELQLRTHKPYYFLKIYCEILQMRLNASLSLIYFIWWCLWKTVWSWRFPIISGP